MMEKQQSAFQLWMRLLMQLFVYFFLVMSLSCVSGQNTNSSNYVCTENTFTVEFTLSSTFHSGWRSSSNCSLPLCSDDDPNNKNNNCRSSLTPCYQYRSIDNNIYCAPGSLCSILTPCDNITGECIANVSVCVVNSCCVPQAVCLPLLWTSMCPSNNHQADSTQICINLTFAPMVTYATGNIGSTPYIGDFNGDGIQDIAVLKNDNDVTISVLFGNSNGILILKPTSTVIGHQIYEMIIIDLNNDKQSDIVIVSDDPQNIDVYLTNNGVILASDTKYPIGPSPSEDTILFGDLNGDLIPDLITFDNFASNLYIFLGNRNGIFSPRNSYGIHNASQFNQRPVLGDFNGDHNLDIVIFDDRGTDSIYIFLGNGDGTLRVPKKYIGDCYSYIIAINDFNEDNIADLLVANFSTSNISVVLGNGNGVFRTRITYDIGFYPFLITVDDFNNDNIPDLVIINSDGSITSAFQGNGDGTFTKQVLDAIGFNPAVIAVDDFNGDNNKDLILINSYGNLTSVFLSNGDGTFRKQMLNVVGFNPESLLIGDFNGDNKTDLAVVNYNANNVGIFLNTC